MQARKERASMCGRFTLRTATHEVARSFRLLGVPFELVPRYNIAPTQAIAAVRHNEREERQLVLFRWGLVPSWAEDVSIGNKMINARSETVSEKPSFRKAFASRRCLIVADGFYEWKKGGKTKQPYYITMKDHAPFAFAGLWERNTRCAEPIESCTIITTSANELMQPLHERMPVILPPEDYDLWLDTAVKETERLTPLLVPFDSTSMKAVHVGTLVNNPRNEVAACVAAASH